MRRPQAQATHSVVDTLFFSGVFAETLAFLGCRAVVNLGENYTTFRALTGEPTLVKIVMMSPLVKTMPTSLWPSTSIGVVTHDDVVLIMKLRSFM